jgi:hypothetical protein
VQAQAYTISLRMLSPWRNTLSWPPSASWPRRMQAVAEFLRVVAIPGPSPSHRRAGRSRGARAAVAGLFFKQLVEKNHYHQCCNRPRPRAGLAGRPMVRPFHIRVRAEVLTLLRPLCAALIELAMEFRSMAEHLERRAQGDQEEG